VDKVAAYHEPSAAFTRFAVNCSNVSLVNPHPFIYIFTETMNHIKLWGLVVIKAKFLAHLLEAPI
jgi:hypothetical protein